jgi:hypothetical protein
MSKAEATESDSSEDEISLCLCNQCKGCLNCQNGEALRAEEKTRQLESEQEDLQRRLQEVQAELEHTRLLRITICRHFLIVTKEQERCDRCGLVRPRVRS